jgi:hypothetical protein
LARLQAFLVFSSASLLGSSPKNREDMWISAVNIYYVATM